MTIAAALLTPEGVVLGSDSTMTVMAIDQSGAPVVTKLLTGTQKLFPLGRTRSCGIVIYKDAYFGLTSYRDLFAEFNATLGETMPPIADLAQQLLDFADMKWVEQVKHYGWSPAPEIPDTGMLIGGRGGAEAACCYAKVNLRPSQDVPRIEVITELGWFALEGCPGPTNRLIFGADEDAVMRLVEAGIIEKDKVDDAWRCIVKANLLRAAPHPLLPLRDGIDYLHFMIFATIKYYKFVEGPAPCGGKIEIACVTTDRGFRWVTHKSLDWCASDTEGQTEYSPLDPHGHGR